MNQNAVSCGRCTCHIMNVSLSTKLISQRRPTKIQLKISLFVFFNAILMFCLNIDHIDRKRGNMIIEMKTPACGTERAPEEPTSESSKRCGWSHQ